MEYFSDAFGLAASNVGPVLQLLSVTDAAQLLGRSVRTIRYWQAQARMPQRIKVGRRLMYRLQDLKLTRPVSGDPK